MVNEISFYPNDAGVYADGSFGHQHIRCRLADLICAVDNGMGSETMREVAASLSGDMPNDAWDEDEALVILNDATEGAEWAIYNGDLLLEAALAGDER